MSVGSDWWQRRSLSLDLGGRFDIRSRSERPWWIIIIDDPHINKSVYCCNLHTCLQTKSLDWKINLASHRLSAGFLHSLLWALSLEHGLHLDNKILYIFMESLKAQIQVKTSPLLGKVTKNPARYRHRVSVVESSAWRCNIWNYETGPALPDVWPAVSSADNTPLAMSARSSSSITARAAADRRGNFNFGVAVTACSPGHACNRRFSDGSCSYHYLENTMTFRCANLVRRVFDRVGIRKN